MRYLQERQYQIVEQNYRTRYGEVDLIAVTGKTLVVIEVKAWDAYGEDQLEFSIGTRKIRSIIRTTRDFMKHRREYADYRVRFDVIFLQPDSGDIRHLEHAFTEMGEQW